MGRDAKAWFPIDIAHLSQHNLSWDDCFARIAIQPAQSRLEFLPVPPRFKCIFQIAGSQILRNAYLQTPIDVTREAGRRYPFSSVGVGGVGEAGRPKKPPLRPTPPADRGKDKGGSPTRLLMVNGEWLIVNELIGRS